MSEPIVVTGHASSRPSINPNLPVSTAAPVGLISILIPCCGGLEYTKLCVPSVLKHSRNPFELIFVDVGSLDGTADYLAGVASTCQVLSKVRVEIVRAQTDMDIKQAIQDAIVKSRGEYIVLLNNDTVVTDAWLNQLIGLATMSPTLGIVGPMSNYAAPPQLVEVIPYRIGPKKGARTSGAEMLVDVSAVANFAKEHRETNKGKWLETDRVGGFCLLMKREVLNRIHGQLSQWSDLSLFDTDILSSKARQEGFTLAVCRDLFIHHFGTRTFAQGAPVTGAPKSSSPR